MHFDDRLATVLRVRADGERLARIQYRQLLDILGTLPVEAQGPQIDAAAQRLGELGKAIPAGERASMMREPGLRLRNPRLVALLAGGEPAVAAAAVDTADLSEEEWLDLAPALPPAARALVGRRQDIGPRAADLFQRLGMVPPGLPAAAEAQDLRTGNIGAIVQRIENFRKAREPGEVAAVAPSAPAPERSPVRLKAFDFATDAEGCIVWSDPGMAPMVLGLRLASHAATAPASARATCVLALRHRQPLRGLVMDLAGAPALAGRWQIDAAPCFDPTTGAYTGHVGRMRRQAEAPPPAPAAAAESEADRMRQLLHELRTPVNAVQGFAEVIQQQLFGPAPHEYRALAASVAGDAARVLAGLDELERLARLESGRMELEADRCDLAEVLSQAVAQLRPFTEPRSGGFAPGIPAGTELPVRLARTESERLVWRLLATLAGAAAPGESLELQALRHDGMAEVLVGLPGALAALDEAELWQALAPPAAKALSAGMFSAGFSLRLARAEAVAAGGALERREKRLILTLPDLTAADPSHSTKGSSGAQG